MVNRREDPHSGSQRWAVAELGFEPRLACLPALPPFLPPPSSFPSLPSKQDCARYGTGVPKTFLLLGPEINICFSQCKYPSVFNEVISGHFLALLTAWKSLSIWEKRTSWQFLPFPDETASQRGQLTHPRSHSQNSNPRSLALVSRLCASVSCFLDTSLALQPTAPRAMTGRRASTDTAFPLLASLVNMALIAPRARTPFCHLHLK